MQRWRFLEEGHLPIVMLTADARAEAQATCEAAGADAYLTKPINSRELMYQIAQLADQQTPPAAESTPARQLPPDNLDEAVLDNLAQFGGPSFVQGLLASFEEDSERSLRDIERALDAQNYGQWHDQLHMLKGGASDVGANLLAQLCTEAERIKPYEMSAPSTRQKLEEVRFALVAAQTALTVYLDQKLRAESN
jgi:two-component system sensor histidine kinase RpfC